LDDSHFAGIDALFPPLPAVAAAVFELLIEVVETRLRGDRLVNDFVVFVHGFLSVRGSIWVVQTARVAVFYPGARLEAPVETVDRVTRR
jgi:hypothetical protein